MQHTKAMTQPPHKITINKKKLVKKPQKSFQNLNHYLKNFNQISVPNLETPSFFPLQNNYSQTYTQIKNSFIFFPHACASSTSSEKLDRNNFFFMFSSAQKKRLCKRKEKMFLRISWRLAIVEIFFKHKKIFCLLFNELFLPSPRMLIN